MLRAVIIVWAVIAATLPLSRSAAQTTAESGVIIAGSCSKGTIAAELSEAEVPDASFMGSLVAEPVAYSFTTVDVSMRELTVAAHSVRIGDVCGTIGGPPNAADALVIALSGPDGHSGFAYINPNGENGRRTDVSLYVVAEAVDISTEEARDIAIAAATRTAEEARAEATEPATVGSQVLVGALEAEQAQREQGDAASAPQPTATRVPTVRPEPTPTATAPAVSAEELAYLDAVSVTLDTMGGSLVRIGDLFLAPRLDDPTWYAEIEAEWAIWDQEYVVLSQLVPPPAFAEVHQKLLDAYTLIVQSKQDAARGFATLDGAPMNEAANKIGRANDLMGEAAVLMYEIARERGLL